MSHRPVPSPPTKRTRIDAETLDRLAERYTTGETLHTLAAEFSVERALIADLLRERGIPVRYRIVSDDDLAEAAALYVWTLAQARR